MGALIARLRDGGANALAAIDAELFGGETPDPDAQPLRHFWKGSQELLGRCPPGWGLDRALIQAAWERPKGSPARRALDDWLTDSRPDWFVMAEETDGGVITRLEGGKIASMVPFGDGVVAVDEHLELTHHLRDGRSVPLGGEERRPKVALSRLGSDLLLASHDGEIGTLLRAPPTGTPLRRVRGGRGPFEVVAAANARIATGATSGVVDLWRADPLEHMVRLMGHQSAVRALALNPEGTLLASVAHSPGLRLWSTTEGRAAGGAYVGAHTVALHFQTPSRLLALDGAGALRVLDAVAGRVVATQRAPTHAVGLCGLPGARVVVVHRWGLELRTAQLTTESCWIARRPITAATVAGDAIVVAASDRLVRVALDVAAGLPALHVGYSLKGARLVCWHPSRPLLAASGDDELVILEWHPASAHLEESARLPIEGGRWDRLAWSPCGAVFGVEGSGERTRIFGTEGEDDALSAAQLRSSDGGWEASVGDGRLMIDRVAAAASGAGGGAPPPGKKEEHG